MVASKRLCAALILGAFLMQTPVGAQQAPVRRGLPGTHVAPGQHPIYGLLVRHCVRWEIFGGKRRCVRWSYAR